MRAAFDVADELHVRADALQLAYRRRRRELIESGWPTVGRPEDAGPVRVVGSPARRHPDLNRAWVHRADQGGSGARLR